MRNLTHMFFNISRIYQICHAVFGTVKNTLELSICGHTLDEYPDIEMKVPFFRKLKNTMVFLKIVMGGEKAKHGMDRAIASIKFDLSKDMRTLAGLCENTDKRLLASQEAEDREPCDVHAHIWHT